MYVFLFLYTNKCAINQDATVFLYILLVNQAVSYFWNYWENKRRKYFEWKHIESGRIFLFTINSSRAHKMRRAKKLIQLNCARVLKYLHIIEWRREENVRKRDWTIWSDVSCQFACVWTMKTQNKKSIDIWKYKLWRFSASTNE